MEHPIPVRTLLPLSSAYALPKEFMMEDYVETEQEFWALFPETQGRRVNFCQVGLTAQLYIDVVDRGLELEPDEAYFLLPCPDHHMRPIRMKALRHLTIDEFRMSRLTAMKLAEFLRDTGDILDRVHTEVVGDEE